MSHLKCNLPLTGQLNYDSHRLTYIYICLCIKIQEMYRNNQFSDLVFISVPHMALVMSEGAKGKLLDS